MDWRVWSGDPALIIHSYEYSANAKWQIRVLMSLQRYSVRSMNPEMSIGMQNLFHCMRQGIPFQAPTGSHSLDGLSSNSLFPL